jgi:putative oxidoreductase
MSQTHLTSLATMLLRVALGFMFLAHSLYLMPGWLAYVVFSAEALAGIFLVLGIQTRWVALATVPILAGATWAHSGNGWMFGYENGGWEYPIYLTLLAIVQGMLGDGVLALNRSFTPRKIKRFGQKDALQ